MSILVKKSEKEIRDEVVSATISLYSKGLNSTLSGNVSARLGENTMLLTPTGSTGILKGSIRPDQLSIVTLDGELINGPKNSSEWRVHAKIYKEMPKINAIVHPHPIDSIFFAMNNDISKTSLIPEIFVELGEARYYLGSSKAPYVGISKGASGSQELADDVFSEIKRKEVSIVIMEGHGTVAIGTNMAEALGRAEQLEYYAKISNMKTAQKR